VIDLGDINFDIALSKFSAGLSGSDMDNDGLLDVYDNDSDNDGIEDDQDWDDDNDGIPDAVDAEPLNSANTTEIALPIDAIYKGGEQRSSAGVQ
jgi:hypothetical protein